MLFRSPDPQHSGGFGRRCGAGDFPGLRRRPGLRTSDASDLAHGRGTLCTAFRRSAEPRRPGGQSRLHWHRRRPGHARDPARPGIHGSVCRSRHRPALASRPLPRDHLGPGTRTAHRADARPPEGAGSDGLTRPGVAEFRSLPRQPAGGRSALLPVQGQSGLARTGRHDHGQRARTGGATGAPHDSSRFGSFARLLRSASGRPCHDGRTCRPAGAARQRTGHPRCRPALGKRPPLPGGRTAIEAGRAARPGRRRLLRDRRVDDLLPVRPRRTAFRRSSRRVPRPAAGGARSRQVRDRRRRHERRAARDER